MLSWTNIVNNGRLCQKIQNNSATFPGSGQAARERIGRIGGNLNFDMIALRLQIHCF